MSYLNAEKILPPELLAQIRQYAEGVCIYIPRANEHRVRSRDTLLAGRNAEICRRYACGESVRSLAGKYYLSIQAIYKIIAREND